MLLDADPDKTRGQNNQKHRSRELPLLHRTGSRMSTDGENNTWHPTPPIGSHVEGTWGSKPDSHLFPSVRI